MGLGANLTFTNENGGQSLGTFTSASAIVASGWGLAGTLVNGDTEIDWGNGSKWTRIPVNISGPWKFGNAPANITISNGQLIFTNERGGQSMGMFITASEVEAVDWGNLTAVLSGNGETQTLTWANQSIWVRLLN